MASVYIPQALRRAVRAADKERCAYCRTYEKVVGYECEVDHIVPSSAGGQTAFENLCLCCRACNGHKASRTSAIAPETGERVALFHPRKQQWVDHFVWSEDSTQILGLTPQGHATVKALQLNHLNLRIAREYWKLCGVHPPTEEFQGK